MRFLLFVLLFSCGTLSACSCDFVPNFSNYSSGFFYNSDTAGVIHHVKMIEFRNPEEGAYLYDFVVLEHLYGGMVPDTITLWGQDGGNCNGPIRQMMAEGEYLLLHSAAQSIFSYFGHTLENFENPYPIYDFPGCGPAALKVENGEVVGPLAPNVGGFTIDSVRANIDEIAAGTLVSTADGQLPAVEFNAWPNPTSGALNLSFQSPVPADRFDLIDITGRVVRTSKNAVGQIVRNASLDANDLPAGVYIARVLLTNGRVGSKRIIVH